ncbi:MAG: ketoacyl-ACP synthase III [Clostridiales bacterium]|jgi:3-oxoacyl-[acyl-carrier-protein] synthase-3|nr:ketoacyl-ACP synthase III [Clostridiales bacterium]
MISIVGTGKFLPTKILSNHDLEKLVDTTDEWIVKRTGIKQRYVVTDETVLDMALTASEQALKNANCLKSDIDLVVCATISGDYLVPSVSNLVAGALGLEVPSMDINAACSGFVYALDVVTAYIQSGKADTVLLIGTDKMSRLTNFADRNTCVLFGDAAGAFVIKKGDQLKSISLTSKGSQELMNIPHVQGNAPFAKKYNRQPYLYMEGSEVYKFAVKALTEEVKKVVGQAGYNLNQVKWLVPHQANLRIIETAAKTLGFEMSQVLFNIQQCGNTVSACVPSIFHDAFLSGKFQKGDIVVVCVFGGGLTTGAAVFKI